VDIKLCFFSGGAVSRAYPDTRQAPHCRSRSFFDFTQNIRRAGYAEMNLVYRSDHRAASKP
jgi:hypothetical protein